MPATISIGHGTGKDDDAWFLVLRSPALFLVATAPACQLTGDLSVGLAARFLVVPSALLKDTDLASAEGEVDEVSLRPYTRPTRTDIDATPLCAQRPVATNIARRKGEFDWRQFAVFRALSIRTVFVGMFEAVGRTILSVGDEPDTIVRPTMSVGMFEAVGRTILSVGDEPDTIVRPTRRNPAGHDCPAYRDEAAGHRPRALWYDTFSERLKPGRCPDFQRRVLFSPTGETIQ